MAIAYTGVPAVFVACEGSPSAADVLFGAPIFLEAPEDLGTVALECLKAHPAKPDSLEYDDKKPDAVLNLRGATAVILPVSVHPVTGDLVICRNPPGSKRVVEGIYNGSDSVLSIV